MTPHHRSAPLRRAPGARIEIVETDPTAPEALYCLSAYLTELKRRLGFRFEMTEALAHGAEAMRPPRGSFLVALSDGLPVGCAGLMAYDGSWAEVKRVWVAPTARGLGLARDLMDEIETAARRRAVPVLRLDTNSGLPEALALYRRLGWSEIPRYNDSDEPDAFFEKRL